MAWRGRSSPSHGIGWRGATCSPTDMRLSFNSRPAPWEETMRRSIWMMVAILIAAAGLAGAAIGQDLPKLPDALVLPQSPDSPGKVTFLHVSHMGERPDCTRCHPKLFSIGKHTGVKAAPAQKIT